MIEKWYKVPDEAGETGAVKRDLFQVFNRISHESLSSWHLLV